MRVMRDLLSRVGSNDYLTSYYKSFVLRAVINLVFLVVVHLLMVSTVENYPSFIVDITKGGMADSSMFEKAGYLFDETSILVTLSGLILVALMTLHVGMGFFVIVPDENVVRFRVRLFLYTIASLAICCIITLYLFFVVGVMSSITSYRIGADNSFIWTYPFYAIVLLFYVTDIYGFLTKNSLYILQLKNTSTAKVQE